MRVGIAALLCCSSFGVSLFAAGDTVLPAEEMEKAKAALLAWTTGLRSFDGHYTITQYTQGEPEDEGFEFDILYRFQGPNRLLTHRMMDREGHLVDHTDALLDGHVTSMHAIDEQGNSATIDMTSNVWTFPEGSLISPEMIVGALRGGPPLSEFLATGESALLLRDGKKVLRHIANGYLVEIWLDEGWPVSRYDISFWGFTVEEIAQRWAGDPYEVRQPVQTLLLGNYTTLDGMPFPTTAVLTTWTWNQEQLAAMKAQREADGWDALEYHVQVCTGVESEADVVQKFALDVAATRINIELPRSAFEIELPEHVIVWNGSGKAVEHSLVRRYAWSVTTGIVVVAVLAALGLGVWLWKKRH